MSMATLLALAERCEAAEGPDRELDLAIGQALGVDSYYLKNWTASLDAAMTLVPEGCDWCVSKAEFATVGVVEGPDGTEITATARTPALALCAAALRARASQGNSNE